MRLHMCMCRRLGRNLSMAGNLDNYVPRSQCAGCNVSRSISRSLLARNATGDEATSMCV